MEQASGYSESSPEVFPIRRPFCGRCVELRSSKNYCPICEGCYEDDDFDSKMIECGKCEEWVHSQCEGLSDEWYEILSLLPDSVEFLCKLCLKEEMPLWKEAIKTELVKSLTSIVNILITLESARHMLFLERKVTNRQALSNSALKEKKVGNEIMQKNGGLPSRILDFGQSVSSANDSPSKNSNSNFDQLSANMFSAPVFDIDGFNCSLKDPQIYSSEYLSKTDSKLVSSTLPSNAENQNSNVPDKIDIASYSRALFNENSESFLSNVDLYNTDFQLNKLDVACSSDLKGNRSATESSLCLLNSSDDESDLKKIDKNSPYSLVAKVSKDIDDDCLSSDGSWCDRSDENSDSEIESLVDVFDDVNGLKDIKDKVAEDKYRSVAQFHIDVLRVFESGTLKNELSTQITKEVYLKLLKNNFSWFKPESMDIFPLIDSFHPFPMPYFDHSYSSSKRDSWYGCGLVPSRSPLSLNSSPTKSSGYLKKDLLSPNKWSFTTNSDVFSPTKSERFDCSPLKMVDSKRFLTTAFNKVQPSQDRVVDSRKCVLCNVSADSDPNDEGRLLYLGQDEWLHVNCALWSSEVYEEDDGGLQNVYVALSRGRQIRCASCNERGATIGCCFKTCQLAFHFSCARRNGCFFGEDKGIFCSSHLASAKDSSPTSDFRIERCVFVNMDSEKRKWKKIPKDNIKVIIGSLTITELGSISSNVDCNDALIPINFSCTRMYWSTKNPTKKVKYTCRIKRNNSVRKAVVPDVFHKTVNHSLASNIVEEQLEQIKIWHKDVKERELAEQTKETNIVPPHMCPMYCEILLKEYLGSNRINPKLSYSLQSVISSDIVLEQSDLLKLGENPKSLNISNSSQSPLCESNELLENFVSEEDGKIISMVLKEMDSLSVSTALPSLNRISPVIFESLSNGDDILNCSDEELLSDKEKRDTAESFPIRPNTPNSVQDVNLVETTDAKDNSSAQIENEIGSEEVNSESTTSPSLIQQNALDSNSNTENSNPENVPAKETSVISLDEDSQNNQLLVELPLQINGEDTAVSPECSRSDPNDMQKISIPSNAFDKNNDPNSVVPDVSGVSQVSDSSNERAEQNNDESQTVIAQISQELEQTVVKEDENCIQSEVLASELPSTNPSPNKPIKGVDQSFPLKMGNLRVNLCPLKKEMLSSEPVLIRPDFGNKGVCENRNCSSPSPKVKRRKICKVKPILSEESRKKTRSISCEDQHLNSSSIPCEQNQPLNSETPLSLQTPKGRRLLRSGSHHRRSSKLKRSLKSKRIQMKRNYKTVIKKYPLRSAIKKNTPIETVQIEINETLELPSDDDDVCIEKLKRKWCSEIMESKSINTNLFQSSVKKTPKRRGHSKVTSEDKEENIEAEEGQSSSVKTRSHQVVSFSDDRSGITVSITNNNLCDLAESRKRKKFRHKKIYQLDGAADGTSSDDSSMEVNLIPDYMKSHHSDLAMRIKQQSLARSCPSEEGPYKCSKCKRLYRTKESYSRHIETCTFEVDSSSSSDEDENLSANEPRSAVNQRTNVDKQSADSIIQAPTNSSNVIASSYIEGIGQAVAKIGDEVITLPEGGSNANSSLQKLQKMCHQQVNVEDIKGNYTVHRQIRIGMKKPAGTKIISDSDKLMDMDFIPDKSESDEVFVPSKFVPTVKKSESPRKYTNVKLFKGKQGFQYRRALPQSPIVAKSSAQQIPQIIPDMQCGRLQGSSSQNVVNLPTQMNQNTFPVQSTINSLGTYQSHQIAQLNPDLTSMSQVMTVVSNQSVVVPQGYALQYVGSYKDEGSSSNVLTYPSHQPMIITPPMMVAPQPTPVVMNQILNTNIAFTVGASDTIVLKQPAGFLPNVQYMNTQHQSYIQSVNSGYPIEQNQNQVSFETRPTSSCSIANSNVIPQENFLQQNNAFKTNLNLPPKVDLSPSPQRNKPQAHIAPIMKGDVDASSSKPAASAPSILRPFQQMTSATRSVATIAPAIFSTTSPITSFKGIEKTYENRNRSHTSVKDAKSDNVLTWSSRPRPTYSYRDAMKIFPTENPSSVDSRESVGESKLTTDEDSDSGKENVDKNSTESKTDDSDEQVQSYKLILKKDQSTDAKFNILPVSVPKKPLASPEIKELRIKAKVSVGPTRKKQGPSPKNNFEQLGKDFFVASKNILNDLYVNEQVANVTSNSFQMPSGDSKLIDKSKILSPEPHIVFEVTSEDGFKVESEHVSDVWRKVYEAVSEARESLKMGKCSENAGADGAPMKENKFSGLHMLGLTHNAVQYLLEQLPGSKDCHKYSFQFHRRPADELHSECASGCARTEPFKARSPYDIFSWLASKHRRLPFKARPCTDDITFSTRRATSMDLPMAMRYRYLSVTAREAVGVFRSEIHGRGLFCKREIDAGEMVIEYAGQLIRSGLCDMREKFYESKGIGCYMFRIDEETVIDATMHGNAARFINHACDPNCYSRVVDILGKKHIIIFALRRIQRGEELTYDYKFPIEDDKIACSCGARRCRKYLN